MTSPTLEPGGGIPSIGALLSETMTDVTTNIQGYLMAGLAFMAVVLPVSVLVTFVGMFGLYAMMGVGMMASMVGGAAISDSTGDQDLGAMVGALGSFASFGFAFAVFFGLLILMGAALAPVTASLQRAIAAQQRGEGTITFGSAFKSVKQDIGACMKVTVMVSAATFLGLFFCYVGVFIPVLLFSFALPMVAHHRKGALEAMGICARHVRARPGEHAMFALTNFGVSMLASYVPFLGPIFILALTVRAYRKMFGDGPEPVLEPLGLVTTG